MPTTDAIDQALARTLQRLRLKRGSTQEALAYHAGITVAALARIERGQTNPHWPTVRRVITALEISLAELAEELEDPLCARAAATRFPSRDPARAPDRGSRA